MVPAEESASALRECARTHFALRQQDGATILRERSPRRTVTLRICQIDSKRRRAECNAPHLDSPHASDRDRTRTPTEPICDAITNLAHGSHNDRTIGAISPIDFLISG